MSEYLYVVRLDVKAEVEAEFNDIYDSQHVPEILKVPGVLGAKRYVLEKPVPGVPKYMATYRVASPEIPGSPRWVAASDTGDWKPKIRPHTYNMDLTLYRELP